jgi:hypothetical protein
MTGAVIFLCLIASCSSQFQRALPALLISTIVGGLVVRQTMAITINQYRQVQPRCLRFIRGAARRTSFEDRERSNYLIYPDTAAPGSDYREHALGRTDSISSDYSCLYP